jgi:hypothetical protein
MQKTSTVYIHHHGSTDHPCSEHGEPGLFRILNLHPSIQLIDHGSLKHE